MLLLTQRRATREKKRGKAEGERDRRRERETETSFHACAVFRLFIIIQDKSCWWYCTHHSVLSASAACNPPPPPSPAPTHHVKPSIKLFPSVAPECLLNVAISERNPPFSLSLPSGGGSLYNKPSVCHRPSLGVNALTLPRLHT